MAPCTTIIKISIIPYLFVLLILILISNNKTKIKNEIKKPTELYRRDLEGKLLFMRHGETNFNIDKNNKKRRVNKDYIDCRLNEKGIEQAKSRQDILNTLSFEKVYVSPFYRALQTLTFSLSNHPNKDNIIAVVHPLVSEIGNCINDYVLDIKQSKKDFNMNSPIKVDWSLFDEYVKGIKYDENFYYFENFDDFEENEKNKIYEELKQKYDNGRMEEFKIGLSNLAKLRFQKKKRFESLKYAQERFKRFLNYIKTHFKKSLKKTKEKIFVVSHSCYMRIGTDKIPYESKEIQQYHDNSYFPQNCEILSYFVY